MAKQIPEGAATDKLAELLGSFPKDVRTRILRALCDRLAPELLAGKGRRQDEDDDEESDEEYEARRDAGVAGADVSDAHSSGRRVRGGQVHSWESSLGGTGAVDLAQFDRACDKIRNAR